MSGCVPLVIGGAAVGGTMVATDRRSSSTLLDDQGIELRVGRQIYDVVGGSSHVNVTSWAGRVLLTGEVPAEQDRQRAEQVARSVANVREVINDLAVMPASGLGTRTNDSFITSKVKSALAGNSQVAAKDVKVITERGSTYLMGSVTAAEAEAATETARTVSGVERVVRVFEYVTPGQADLNAVPAQPSYPRTTPTQLGEEAAGRPPVSSLGAPAPVAPAPIAPAPAAAPTRTTAPAPASTVPRAAPSPAPAPASQVQSLPPLEPAQSSPVTNSPLR
ncbi:BON domain-containing protein [Comamonas serinivorans]|uniref:BON domain-containing protein n=1 Tax=Comamonas serinivorans TaxID=1082851 RepID=UPI001F1FE51F|nr:BON domain-containing protein [Comamonas serinivorans]